MLPSKLLDTYAHDLKTIELNRSIEEEKEISLGGLCGNLKVILPVAISYNNTYNNCFICANKKDAMLYYSNLSNFLNHEKVMFFPYSYRKPYDDELINNANVVMRTETIQHIKNLKKADFENLVQLSLNFSDGFVMADSETPKSIETYSHKKEIPGLTYEASQDKDAFVNFYSNHILK